MTRLFLVRRGLESYTGPFSIEELVRRYEAMDFSLQDEVAGSFGPWIALDNLPALKKNYPEIARIVRERFLGGWSASDSVGQIINKNGERSAQKSRRKKRKFSYLLSGILVSVALSVGGAAVYLQKNKSFFISNQSEINNLKKELDKIEDLTAFKDKLTPMLPDIIKQMSKSRSSYRSLIGFVRIYAFQFNEGVVSNFKPSLLSGLSRNAAPTDCSLTEWQNQWQSVSDLNGQLGVSLADGNTWWVKILFWNPHWMAWRQDSTLKFEPRSYFEGCLMMAQKALETNQTLTPDAKSEILERLEVIGAILNGRDRSVEANPFGVLGYISCLDRAKNLDELNLCKLKKTDQKSLDTAAETYRSLTELRLTLTRTSKDQVSKSVTKLIQEKDLKATLSQPGLEAEKYLSDIMATGTTSLSEAIQKTQDKFPEVNENY